MGHCDKIKQKLDYFCNITRPDNPLSVYLVTMISRYYSKVNFHSG